MASTGDAASEDQERLERFLEWRRATGREPKLSAWRWLSYVAGIAVLGVIVVALAALLTGDLRATRERLANATERLADAGGQSPGAPAQVRAAPAPDITPPSAPRSDVSLPERPSRLELSERGGSRAEGEAIALPQRSPAPLRTSVSPRPTTLQERSHPSDVAGPALPPGPTSTGSEIRTTPSAPPAPMSAPPALTPGAQDSASESRTEGSSIVSSPTPPVAAPSAAPREPSSGTPTSAATSTPAASSTMATTTPTIVTPVAPRAAPAPPPEPPAAPVKPAPRPVPAPEVATKPLPEPIETVKRLIEHIPEVKVGKVIMRWVKSQPPADAGPPPPGPRSPQTR
jgi:hypothetical protein